MSPLAMNTLVFFLLLPPFFFFARQPRSRTDIAPSPRSEINFLASLLLHCVCTDNQPFMTRARVQTQNIMQ